VFAGIAFVMRFHFRDRRGKQEAFEAICMLDGKSLLNKRLGRVSFVDVKNGDRESEIPATIAPCPSALWDWIPLCNMLLQNGDKGQTDVFRGEQYTTSIAS
jgi:hypothetical protein